MFITSEEKQPRRKQEIWVNMLKANEIYVKQRWINYFRKQSQQFTASEETGLLQNTPLFILLSLCLESIILNDNEMYELTDECLVLLIKQLQKRLNEKEIDRFITMCITKLTHTLKGPNSDWFANFLKKSNLKNLLIKKEKMKVPEVDDEFRIMWEKMKKFVPLIYMIQYCGEVIRKHQLFEKSI